MLKNLSIKYKIAFIALVGFIGFVVFQTASYRLSLQIQGSLQSILKSDFAILKFANDIQLDFSELDKIYQASLAESDMDTLLEADAKAAAMNLRFELLRTNFSVDDPYFNELHEAFQRYVEQTSRHTAAVLTNTLGYEKTLSGYAEVTMLRERYQKAQSRFLNEHYGNFERRLIAIENQVDFVVWFGIALGAILSLLLIAFSAIIIRNLLLALNNAVLVADQVAGGNLEQEIVAEGRDETGQLMKSLVLMRDALKQQNEENQQRERIQDFLAGLNEIMRGDKGVSDLADAILQYLATRLQAQIGMFYHFDHGSLVLLSHYAFTPDEHSRKTFALGEGTVGRVAREQLPQVISEVPDHYVAIESGTGRALPRSILLFPVVFEGVLKGVFEIAAFRRFSDDDIYLMQRCNDAIAVAINSAQSRLKLADMLRQTQEQARELNRQRQELALFNQQLEDKNVYLDQQKTELEASERELIEKSRALEQSGKYKSQFLSTMSHELRTPLNSILILSDALMHNREGHLSGRDVEHARIIHSAGSDLLALINDILDLSKVEEGKMEVVIDEIQLPHLVSELEQQFNYVAREKGLEFQVAIDEGVAPFLYTDSHRLKQILRNFISNALKFTEQGGVYVSISAPDPADLPEGSALSVKNSIRFSVRDTGMGIDKGKQDLVFEAFHQVDGTTSRKYGGTGLGLSISRELAKLLGGYVYLHSEGEGKGSTFSLVLPCGSVAQKSLLPSLQDSAFLREGIRAPSAYRLLVVEDNPVFHRVLLSVFAASHIPVSIAESGKEALERLAAEDFGCLVVDLSLPDCSGLELLRAARSSPRNRDAYIFVYTAEDLSITRKREIEVYADRIITKTPQSILELSREVKRVLDRAEEFSSQPENSLATVESGALRGYRILLVDDDPRNRYSIASVLESVGVHVEMAASGEAGLERLALAQDIDLVLLDIMMPEMDGYEVLRTMRADSRLRRLPVIALTAKAMVGDREDCLKAGATDYLSKPVEPRLLLASILRHLGPVGTLHA
jgi:signal transduction histidine kinase/DNA-binding response OmpR family regulator/HAMP domain-containing protein